MTIEEKLKFYNEKKLFLYICIIEEIINLNCKKHLKIFPKFIKKIFQKKYIKKYKRPGIVLKINGAFICFTDEESESIIENFKIKDFELLQNYYSQNEIEFIINSKSEIKIKLNNLDNFYRYAINNGIYL